MHMELMRTREQLQSIELTPDAILKYKKKLYSIRHLTQQLEHNEKHST